MSCMIISSVANIAACCFKSTSSGLWISTLWFCPRGEATWIFGDVSVHIAKSCPFLSLLGKGGHDNSEYFNNISGVWREVRSPVCCHPAVTNEHTSSFHTLSPRSTKGRTSKLAPLTSLELNHFHRWMSSENEAMRGSCVSCCSPRQLR